MPIGKESFGVCVCTLPKGRIAIERHCFHGLVNEEMWRESTLFDLISQVDITGLIYTFDLTRIGLRLISVNKCEKNQGNPTTFIPSACRSATNVH